MTAVQLLLMDLKRLGIQLKAVGDRLRFAPRSAVTPSLAERMKLHEAELLAMLRSEEDSASNDQTDANAVWQAILDRLAGASHFPLRVMETLGAGSQWVVETADSLGPDGWPVGSIDPDEVPTCRQCGLQEAWQSMAGNWRCQRCDPATSAQRWRERAERWKSDRTVATKTHANAI